MSGPVILGLSGSTSRPSRTAALVRAAGEATAHRTGGTYRHHELLDVHQSLATTLDPRQAPADLSALLAAIGAADVLIVGSPVYKGTYAGLFKHLFDLLDPKALKDKPVLLTATGGTERHALVIDHGLRPLFAFFSADVAATGLYATELDFDGHTPNNPALLTRIDRAALELSWRLALPSPVTAISPIAALAAS